MLENKRKDGYQIIIYITSTYLVNTWHNNEGAGQQPRSKRVRTLVTLLRLLSDKYPCEKYEPPYPLNYGLQIPLLFSDKDGFGIN